MIVRPFEWRDLPALYRYRDQGVYLDSALVLTRGAWPLPGALLSYLAPGLGVFTWVGRENEPAAPLIGQMMHLTGAQGAHLTFIAPQDRLDTAALPALLEVFASMSAERGALRVMADVEEASQAFELLRLAGFALHTRQHIWKYAGPAVEVNGASSWRAAGSEDTIAIRNLYGNLVPGLGQQTESFLNRHPQGLVYCQGEDILAYVELKYGQRGIWAQPFVHPDVRRVNDRLAELFSALSDRHSRPIYICVRSYQSWLESAMEALGAEPGPRQAVMVKHLAISQKAPRTLVRQALEGNPGEMPAPVVHYENRHDADSA